MIYILFNVIYILFNSHAVSIGGTARRGGTTYCVRPTIAMRSILLGAEKEGDAVGTCAANCDEAERER